MNPEFLVVSHRLPVKFENHQILPTDGGLASALRSAHLEDKAQWIGCMGINLPSEQLSLLPEHCSHVELDPEVYNQFYNGYSNSVLWPAFHDRLDLHRFKEEDWSGYFEANSKFAMQIIDSTPEDLPIWLHDYQLMLVPLLVKLHQPQRKISFFLHIPWPELKFAQKIPRLSEIIRSLAKCESVCVHTQEYADNIQAYYDFISEGRFPSRKQLPLKVLPIGICPEDFSTVSDSSFSWKEQPADWKGVNIVGVDRLDYSKGLDHKIEVFSEFLELNPEWRGKITLRQLMIPSREDVTAYKVHRLEVEDLANYVNLKFGTDDWQPVDLFYGRTDAENLKQIYRHGDFCWINSRKDGMNLVAMEYVAAQNPNRPGALILSDQAGCAQHLQGALCFRGNSDVSAYRTLCQALKMSEAEKRVRYRRDMEWITQNDVRSWVEKNLDLLLSPEFSNKKGESYNVPTQKVKNAQTASSHGPRILPELALR